MPDYTLLAHEDVSIQAASEGTGTFFACGSVRKLETAGWRIGKDPIRKMTPPRKIVGAGTHQTASGGS